MQFEARNAACADERWSGQLGELAGVDDAAQQLCLFGEAPFIGGGKLLVEQR
jgi:hypothetical protein